MRASCQPFFLVIFDDRHMIGEDPPEPGVDQQLRALFRRHGFCRRLDGEVRLVAFMQFADHAGVLCRIGD